MSSFFRINFPYGIAKNEKGEWMAFNREYLPLGFTNEKIKGLPGSDYHEYPIYSSYKNLNAKFLNRLIDNEKLVSRNQKGEIVTVFLYSDHTNPSAEGGKRADLWDLYFEKIKILSKLYIPSWM